MMQSCKFLQFCLGSSRFFGRVRIGLALVVVCLMAGPRHVFAQEPTAEAGPPQMTLATAAAPIAKKHKGKEPYTGPTEIVVLPPTPMLDEQGKQRVDADGKPMFNPPVKQLRDKKGHPVFDADGKPVFQTVNNLGYDEHGKKIKVKKEKEPKRTPVSIASGILTVDGWTGKARLNYDIADLKFMYVWAPGIGTTIISLNRFPGATEQRNAFADKQLRVTVEGHAIELSSEKRLLGKRPESAWVAVDRAFVLPAKFPVFGYGTTTRAPYAWPGSKLQTDEAGVVAPPPLPVDVRPALATAPCPAGMMRRFGPAGEEQACVPIPVGAPE